MATTKRRVNAACCGRRLIIDKVETFRHKENGKELYFCTTARLQENGYSTCSAGKQGRRVLKNDQEDYIRVFS